MTTTEQVHLIPLTKLHVSENNTRFPKATELPQEVAAL